jgi:hypothetical protein
VCMAVTTLRGAGSSVDSDDNDEAVKYHSCR